MFTDFNILE